MTRPTYSPGDLALLIPTKDRPAKMRNLLDSLAAQDAVCGRIIVVASGEDIGDLVRSYRDRLPVEYYECDPPGQIRQRNLAISKLDGRTPLVGSLDDDIVVEDGAIAAMIDFWNRVEPETAGVSFNIVNNPAWRHSRLKALFGMSSLRQGAVLRSGYNVATTPVTADLKTAWLSGGATVWRQDILKAYAHREIRSRWAICEDLIFSYPVGKRHPLYVCAAARVRHEHVYDHRPTAQKFRYYGRTITLWRLYFIELHRREMSRPWYCWMIFGQIAARFLAGIFLRQPDNLQYAAGQVEGFIAALRVMTGRADILNLLNE